MSTVVWRPGLKAFVVMTFSEVKMVVRDVAGLIVPIGLPLLILVMSASAAAEEVSGSSGLSGLEVYVLPLVFAVVLTSIGIINMPSFLAYYRLSGILKRLSVTPASPLMVLVAQAVVSAIQAVIGVGLALLVAMTAFDARLPEPLLPAVVVLLLAMAATYAVGLTIAAVAPTPNSAVAIGLITFFLFGAVGGLFGGQSALPEALATIGSYLPFGATVDVLGAVWGGEALPLGPVIGLAATVVIGTGTAALTFRWN